MMKEKRREKNVRIFFQALVLRKARDCIQFMSRWYLLLLVIYAVSIALRQKREKIIEWFIVTAGSFKVNSTTLIGERKRLTWSDSSKNNYSAWKQLVPISLPQAIDLCDDNKSFSTNFLICFLSKNGLR